MNATQSHPNTESWLRTYSKAAVFLLPAIIVWSFTSVFVFPKVEVISRDAGLPPFALNIAAAFLREHSADLSLALLASLVFLEWRSTRWPRYRGVFAGAAVFLMNGLVLVLLAGMLVSMVLAAPALLRAR